MTDKFKQVQPILDKNTTYRISLKQNLSPEYHLINCFSQAKTIVEGHLNFIKCICLTNDEDYFISSSNDLTIKIWNLATKKEEFSLLAHEKSVLSISLSQDNKYLVSCSLDTTIKIWDFESKQALCTLKGHTETVNSVVMHSNCNIIVSCSKDNTIKIWDFKSQSLTATIELGKFANKTIIYEPENIIIASFNNGNIIAFNLNTQLQEFTLVGNQIDRTETKILLASSGKLYSCSLGGRIIVWDLLKRSFAYEFAKSNQGICEIAINEELGILAGALNNNCIKIWDLNTKNVISIFSGHEKEISSLVISAKNKVIISGSFDRKIYVWNLNKKVHSNILYTETKICQLCSCGDLGFAILNSEGKVQFISDNKICDFKEDIEKLTCVCFCKKNSLIITGTKNGLIIAWDTNGLKKSYSNVIGKAVTTVGSAKSSDDIIAGFEDYSIKIYKSNPLNLLQTFTGNDGEITSICFFNQNTNFVTGSEDKSIRIWGMNLEKSFKLLGHKSKVLCTKISPDDKYILSSSNDGYIKIWNYMKRVEEREIFLSQNPVTGIVCIPSQNAFASVSHDGNITLWSFKTFDSICVIQGKSSKLYGIDLYDKESTLLTYGSEAFVKSWKINKRHPTLNLKSGTSTVKCIALSNDNRIVFYSLGKIINVYDIYEKLKLASFEAHSMQINSLELTKDSTELFSCSDDESIKIWSACEYKLLDTLNIHSNCVNCIKISMDRQYIYSGSDDKSIKKTILSTKKEMLNLIGHSSLIYSISLNKNESLLASSSKDKTVKVWDLTTGECIGTYKGHTNDVYSVIFTDDSKYAISSSNDFTIKIWNLNSKREEFTFNGHKGFINSLCLCGNGKFIISTSSDQTVKIWNIEDRVLKYTFEGVSDKIIGSSITKDEQFLITGHSGYIGYWKIGNNKNNNYNTFAPEDFFDYYYQNPIEYYNALEVVEGTRNDGILNKANNIVFGPFCFTLVHYLAYYGKVDILKKILNSSFTLECDKFGKSPLYYAIVKNQQDFIDNVFNFLISIKETNPSQFSQCAFALRNDFSAIIKNSSSYLHIFLKEIFISKPSTKARFQAEFPMFRYNQALMPILEDFVQPLKDINIRKIPSVCKYSSIPIPTSLNSLKSLDLLKSIIKCSNLEIFRSQFIQYFIELQWKALRIWALVYSFLILALIVFMVLLIEYSPWNLLVLIPFLIINMFLIAWEFMQYLKNRMDYFIDYMNILDILRIIIVVVWIILEFSGIYNLYVTWIMMLLTLIRGLTVFRFFNKTRYYYTLIYRALNDIKYFILIFVYSTLAFGILYMISRSEKASFYTIWKNPYSISFGGYDNNEQTDATTEYMVFIGSTFINVVLMLNLLISILGDSFEQFQIEKDIIDYNDKAEIILEMQQVIYAKDFPCELVFMHVCESPFININNDWAGKINFIEKSIEKYTKSVEVGFEGIKETLTERNVEIMDGIERLERKMLEMEENFNKHNSQK
ncbi:hypothetical protein SteCoe_36283 [Stentor coeruleus]|uniref:Uncharacterized protein n=1 Tax=Stentor coeruleus TaxID=5963 RepID=A0A1R2AQH8_9CILI|nr:hypothetical protein SteCoe_36283 [Stentor coeruleus]